MRARSNILNATRVGKIRGDALFLKKVVLKFAHNKKSYYLCSEKINQPLKTFEL